MDDFSACQDLTNIVPKSFEGQVAGYVPCPVKQIATRLDPEGCMRDDGEYGWTRSSIFSKVSPGVDRETVAVQW